MPIKIDKDTKQRIVHAKHVGDVEYDLEGDSPITRESVPLLCPWKDNTGEGGPDSKQQQTTAGLANQFFGEDIALEGGKMGNLNEVGENAEIFRRRTIRRNVNV